jgi:hypothetical protein
MPRRHRTAMAAGLRQAAGLVAGLALLAGCSRVGEPRAPSPPRTAEVDGLVARCAEAMARDVCTVRNDTGGASAGASSGPVLVAGTGAVDPKAYGEIRAAGEAMCQWVRQHCTEDWRGSACRTARSLWPALPAPS